MASFLSGRGEPNYALWFATRKSNMALSCLSCLLSITRCAPLDLDNVYFYLLSNVILRYFTSSYIALHSKLSVFLCVSIPVDYWYYHWLIYIYFFLCSVYSGMQFSTKDNDNDISSSSCAIEYKGGWWYRSCHQSNLNGMYHGGQHDSHADGINWYTFRGHHYSLKRSEMKLKLVSQNWCSWSYGQPSKKIDKIN